MTRTTELATIASGDGSRIGTARRTLVHNDEEWRALWTAHMGPDAAAPAVDFSRDVVAAAFLGERPIPGYTIEIVARDDDAGGTTLETVERSPPRGLVAAQIVTSPFHIVALRRPAGGLTWAEPGQAGGDRPAAAPSPASSSFTGSAGDSSSRSSSTGLDPRVASALAYLVGPASGVLVLLAESRHETVRFHAWQSIVALGGLGLIAVGCYGLAFAALFVSAAGFRVLLWLAAAVWLVGVGAWLFCLWRAWNGQPARLPIAASVADHLAPVRPGAGTPV